MRKFCSGDFFHIFNKSIANFGIFKDGNNCQRFIETLDYYNTSLVKSRFSWAVAKKEYYFESLFISRKNQLFKTISYCIMPDHYHLLVKILRDNVFAKFINDLENSFTRYFNIKFKRKGPLWQSSFKSVRIKSNKQLLHVTRYHHLNPVTNYLTDKPENWKYSSYNDYINNRNLLKNYLTEVLISNPNTYKKFVENNVDYQRKLKLIKKLIIE